MKHLLFTLLLVLTCNLTFAVQDTTLTTTNEVERLIDKYSAKVEASITSLAETLQQPAEKIYTTLVKQQVVKAYGWIMTTIIGLLMSLLGFWGIQTARSEQIEVLGIIIVILFGAMFLVGLLGFFTDGLSGLFNPEYGALMEIKELFN